MENNKDELVSKVSELFGEALEKQEEKRLKELFGLNGKLPDKNKMLKFKITESVSGEVEIFEADNPINALIKYLNKELELCKGQEDIVGLTTSKNWCWDFTVDLYEVE